MSMLYDNAIAKSYLNFEFYRIIFMVHGDPFDILYAFCMRIQLICICIAWMLLLENFAGFVMS